MEDLPRDTRDVRELGSIQGFYKVIIMEINKLYRGDCLQIMKQIPDKSIDLVLTDTPYGIGIKGKV